MDTKSIFDLRSLLPRAKRRRSPRENLKGVTGSEAGKPRSCAEDAKRARRRAARAKGLAMARHLIQSNPSGSKLLRQFEKQRTGLSSKNVSYKEAQRQYHQRMDHGMPFPRGDRRNTEWLGMVKAKPTATAVEAAFAQ